MEWAGYKPCCHRAALDPKASFCGTCAAPLLRCMNFSDCMQLVEPLKPCPVCLDPELIVEDGAVVSGGVGARLAIPLKLRNHNAELKRPIYLKRLVKRESGRDEARVRLDWEIVEPGSERSFLIEAGPFDTDGVARVELLMTLAIRSKEGFEEAFTYGGSLLLTVSRDSTQQVVQNIDLSGAHFETGGLVKTDLRLDQHNGDRRETTQGRRVLSLERFEVSELTDGLRGYAASGVRVPGTVKFRFLGFPESDAPSFEIGLGARGALAFGRSARKRDPENNPTPMDVTLRVYDGGGALDFEASNRISRHHFDLRVLNDRLCLHARSAKGALVNGLLVPTGAIEPLEDGDVIAPAREVANAAALRVAMRAGPHGRADVIELRREPGARA